MNIEEYVTEKLKSGKDYVHAVLDFCDDQEIEYESLPNYLTKSILLELENEGIEMGILRKTKKIRFLC